MTPFRYSRHRYTLRRALVVVAIVVFLLAVTARFGDPAMPRCSSTSTHERCYP